MSINDIQCNTRDSSFIQRAVFCTVVVGALVHCGYMDLLFLGLGNPPAYRGTRHNIGKDFVEGLVYGERCQWRRVEHGRVGCLLIGPHVVTCMVSDGYMNEIGQDLFGALAEIDPSRLVVIHDEVDLPVGVVRLSYNRSSGGHKGVASVAVALGTNAFHRLRIGVGRDEGDLKQYVLDSVSPEDMKVIASALGALFPDIILNQLLVS